MNLITPANPRQSGPSPVRADGPSEPKPWVNRVPSSFLDARTTFRSPSGQPLTVRQRFMLLILESFARTRAYLWCGNRELAESYGCEVRTLQEILAELEAAKVIRRVMTEKGRHGRVGIVLFQRANPDLPVADAKTLHQVVSLMKETIGGGASMRKTAPSSMRKTAPSSMRKTAPEERESPNKDEVEESSSSTTDDNDLVPRSGREPEDTKSEALEAIRKCMGEDTAEMVEGDGPELVAKIAHPDPWRRLEHAAYLAPLNRKGIPRPKGWLIATANSFPPSGPSVEAQQAKRKFLEREARKQARSVQAPPAPDAATAGKETAREKADGTRRMVRENLERNGGFNPGIPGTKMVATIFAEALEALEVMPDGQDLAAELARDYAEVLTYGRSKLADRAANPGPRLRTKTRVTATPPEQRP